MKSEAFNLSKQMVSLLAKNGITEPTPVQKEIIPAITAGRDVLAQSETGSGKTISFAVPLIEQIGKNDGLCALVLVPTRELCLQITKEFAKFSVGKQIGVTSVYGGVSISNQIRNLKKANVVIATPGRLIDLLDRGAVHPEKIRYLVFDEADRMLDMGFIPDIEIILKKIPKERQTMLFSATISKEIAKLSKNYLKNPVSVKLQANVKAELLHQTYYRTYPDQKLPLLIYLLKKERDLALVFCNRKRITDDLTKKLSANGVHAKALHGDISQNQRERVTSDFRKKKFNVLIATDVAARGLHIDDITHVYNYEIPRDVDSYTHRIGRTARAGKAGDAISFVTGQEDQKFFKQILFEYNGSITMKTIKEDSLPKIESKPGDRKRKTDEFPRDDRKDTSKKPYSHDRKRNDSERSYSRDKKSYDSGRTFSRDKKREVPENKFSHDKKSDDSERKFSHDKKRDDSGRKFSHDKKRDDSGHKFSHDKKRDGSGRKFSHDKKRDESGRKFSNDRDKKESVYQFARPEKKKVSEYQFVNEERKKYPEYQFANEKKKKYPEYQFANEGRKKTSGYPFASDGKKKDSRPGFKDDRGKPKPGFAFAKKNNYKKDSSVSPVSRNKEFIKPVDVKPKKKKTDSNSWQDLLEDF